MTLRNPGCNTRHIFGMQAASSILTWHHSLLSHGILEILHSHREAQASSNILCSLVHWSVLFSCNTKLIPFLVSVWSRLLKSTKIFYILQYTREPFRSAKPCLGYRPDHITASSQPHTARTFFVFMIRVWILNPILSQSNRSQFNCNESFQRINEDSPSYFLSTDEIKQMFDCQ